jgi:hypothetical protein
MFQLLTTNKREGLHAKKFQEEFRNRLLCDCNQLTGYLSATGNNIYNKWKKDEKYKACTANFIPCMVKYLAIAWDCP